MSADTALLMSFDVSAPGSVVAARGLLDKSSRLVILPLLDVSSCSLVLQSLATYTDALVSLKHQEMFSKNDCMQGFKISSARPSKERQSTFKDF